MKVVLFHITLQFHQKYQIHPEDAVFVCQVCHLNYLLCNFLHNLQKVWRPDLIRMIKDKETSHPAAHPAVGSTSNITSVSTMSPYMRGVNRTHPHSCCFSPLATGVHPNTPYRGPRLQSFAPWSRSALLWSWQPTYSCALSLPREPHLFTVSQAFPLLALAHKNSPKLSNICRWTVVILVQGFSLKRQWSFTCRVKERCETPMRRWSAQMGVGKTLCSVWDPAHSPPRPPACPSVLEAKIEIPDTPVVNFAHASPALEQDLL